MPWSRKTMKITADDIMPLMLAKRPLNGSSNASVTAPSKSQMKRAEAICRRTGYKDDIHDAVEDSPEIARGRARALSCSHSTGVAFAGGIYYSVRNFCCLRERQ